jgi:uncharacterized cupin superfamily protein
MRGNDVIDIHKTSLQTMAKANAMTKMRSFWSLAASALLIFSSSSHAFTINHQKGMSVIESWSAHRPFVGVRPSGRRSLACSTEMRLAPTSNVDISSPSPDQAAEMGVRDWPQQLKKGTWSEQVPEGQTLIRYILDGTGTLVVNRGKRATVGPGTLIEINGDASIEWEASDEMIILTPGFEEGGKLLIVAVAFVVLCASLIATSMKS